MATGIYEWPDVQAAFDYMVTYLREGRKSDYGTYGYDLYVPHLATDYVKDTWPAERQDPHGFMRKHAQGLTPPFYAAAWELCRRGVVRPGVRYFETQSTEEGGAGGGFSVTPFGREWLQEAGDHDYAYVPVEPGRLARAFTRYENHFGLAYVQRAHEAVRCYGAHAMLACCAMCGAAAESILLAVAVAKKGDEEAVLKMYQGNGGRGRVEKFVGGQQAPEVQASLGAFLGLLKYWRDAAAHGVAVAIDDDEAFTSIAMLLRLSQFVEDRWSALTAP